MENIIKYFDDFKGASHFAKANPGSKIIRNGDKFKVEGKAAPNFVSEPKPKKTSAPKGLDNNECWDDIPF